MIGGYKFDVWIYVVVLLFYFLIVYIYEEGIVRFGIEKFDFFVLKNVFFYFINILINKYSSVYIIDKERIGSGCKWILI